MERIFYPVGQGAFYAEKHGKFNLVYDCGVRQRDVTHAKSIVDKSFASTDTIDVLFISHFHFDHISLIPYLKKRVRSIRYVIYPYMDLVEKVLLLVSDSRLRAGRLRNMIFETDNYFGAETRCISVRSSDNWPVEFDRPMVLDESDAKEVSGLRPLAFSHLLNWLFIPYNRVRENVASVQEKLTRNGIVIDAASIGALVNDKPTRDTIRRIYDSLPKKINNHSMLLYSGPALCSNSSVCRSKYDKMIFNYGKMCFTPPFARPADIVHDNMIKHRFLPGGCLYTGDMNMNLVDVGAVFGSYFDQVGTIQISHHGALASFDSKPFAGKRYFCPISFGTKNRYGHPDAKVVATLSIRRSYPLCVTEEDCTRLEQTIQ